MKIKKTAHALKKQRFGEGKAKIQPERGEVKSCAEAQVEKSLLGGLDPGEYHDPTARKLLFAPFPRSQARSRGSLPARVENQQDRGAGGPGSGFKAWQGSGISSHPRE